MQSDNADTTHNNSNSLLHKQDPTRLLPKAIVIFYCEGCQTFSHSSGSRWLKAPLDSPLLAEALQQKLRAYCSMFRLTLISSWFFQLDIHHISFGLKLEFRAPDGVSYESICNVVSQIAYRTCRSCSPMVDETRPSSVVQLRQYGAANNKTLRSLEIRVRSNPPAAFNIQMIKQTDHGLDFFLTNDTDAMALYYFIKSRAPVRDDEIHKSSDNTMSCQNVISATVSPICEDDLVQLPSRSKFPSIARFSRLEEYGPLAICTGVQSTLYFVDPLTSPFNVQLYNYPADEYWSQPFEPLKTSKELVEYIVHDVRNISRVKSYLFAEMRVTQVLDSGKVGMPVSVRSHLGYELKPGDHALGYDLSDIDVEGYYKDILPPPVVLVKKYCLKTRYKDWVSRMKVSPEYEQVLKELEKNEAAMFNLSLDTGDPNSQISEMSLEQPQTSGLDLEDLLADLSLHDEH